MKIVYNQKHELPKCKLCTIAGGTLVGTNPNKPEYVVVISWGNKKEIATIGSFVIQMGDWSEKEFYVFPEATLSVPIF